ncbi:hypothetical protein SAMD00019534_014240 [Acytostelium subglobosum LB1]|uniref:hypothetical protein n=1 Tax=Acytostelium subglobosum LB1 TaxID=1410327 RepID=UPI0006450854|nr:hypothetical protein SAMD00019534_014240 [Acytostelium subglobosum LB1]GAM18249.1 hypothetical protein SAMD00019534_014240 [Acytostelium subglobosum LB1]|eukprot:XP_012758845.1 hypothetical protein SAMD00019534_014240 [Acytostelium subglobosum LB1]
MSETTSTASTSPVAAASPAAAAPVNIKDKNIFGTLEVKIKEVKGCQTHFLLAKCELAQKRTEDKTKPSANHTFVDVFEFRVSSPNSELEIEAWKKNFFFKDKVTGKLVLSINELLTANGEAKWYPLSSMKKTAGAAAHRPRTQTSPPAVDSTAAAPTSPEDTKETNSEGEVEETSPKAGRAKKQKDPPEINLEIKFTKNEPPKEVLKGIVLDGQWTTENSVGSLTNNPHWVKCAQYLLTVKNETTPLFIKLRQPEGTDQRISFFVLNYDSVSVDCKIELEPGQYCIIPYAEQFGFTGKYKINVDSERLTNLEFYPLPKDESTQWKEITINGLWTNTTNGGCDVNLLHWTKSPQHQITLSKSARLCILVSQDDHEKSIGFYVLKQTNDVGKRLVEYRDQVGKTETFKPSCHNGNTMSLEKGTYIVIPSTFDQGLEGAYHITLFTDDQAATFTTVTDTWKNTELVKGTWVGKSAGGSPNNGASFFDNPQYKLKLPKDRSGEMSFFVQLIQESTLADESIGFVLINRDDHSDTVKASTFQNEHLFNKTPNWEKRNDIGLRVTVTPDQSSEYTIIPSTFKPGVNRSFRLQVFSDVPVEIEEIEASEESSDEE